MSTLQKRNQFAYNYMTESNFRAANELIFLRPAEFRAKLCKKHPPCFSWNAAQKFSLHSVSISRHISNSMKKSALFAAQSINNQNHRLSVGLTLRGKKPKTNSFLGISQHSDDNTQFFRATQTLAEVKCTWKVVMG
jgi:hypothetical protein